MQHASARHPFVIAYQSRAHVKDVVVLEASSVFGLESVDASISIS